MQRVTSQLMSRKRMTRNTVTIRIKHFAEDILPTRNLPTEKISGEEIPAPHLFRSRLPCHLFPVAIDHRVLGLVPGSRYLGRGRGRGWGIQTGGSPKRCQFKRSVVLPSKHPETKAENDPRKKQKKNVFLCSSPLLNQTKMKSFLDKKKHMVQPLPRWKLFASSPSGSSTVDPPGREAPWRKPPEQLGRYGSAQGWMAQRWFLTESVWWTWMCWRWCFYIFDIISHHKTTIWGRIWCIFFQTS